MDPRLVLIQKMQNSKLYQNNFGMGHDMSGPLRIEWERLARECQLESVEKAHQQWQQVVMEYMEFLRTGRSFPFAAEMKFMQTFIMNADALDDDELDIDQMELERILSADDDAFVNRQTANVQPPNVPLMTRAVKLVPVSELLKPYALPPPEEPAPVPIPTHHNQPDPNQQFNNLSSLELIFLGYARMLQKMPLPLRLHTKRKIAEIMDDAELKMENSSKSKTGK